MLQQCDSCTTNNRVVGAKCIRYYVFNSKIFCVTAPVIRESTFSHTVAGAVFGFPETFAEIDNHLKVFKNNYVI